ncbi:hypothetical protein [Acidocella sp. KAb 2-4]|uniref:hypothetical protein n=1 Tax=Acidocella sp. KAb 2-4 TaxID=2885158 RepID=UPI001D098ECB|nr:hypothetical protein [Acidocella sp. KAb 2-4]MCB5945930.1 hypothetical protein [Acidocella sp. KAb 2-4]
MRIDPVDVERKRLARLDSPARIKWLREKVSGYIKNLAARTFFRLPTECAGYEIPDPKDEALTACINLVLAHDLNADECRIAFEAEWRIGMDMAKAAGEKIRISALSHIKATGSTERLIAALQAARAGFPDHWPYLTDTDLTALAAGFRAPAKPRRAA